MRRLIFAFLMILAWPQCAVSQVPNGMYFAPKTNIEALDIAAIHQAGPGWTIAVAAYALTDKPLVAELIARAQAGAQIQIYRDHMQVASECRGDQKCPSAAWQQLVGLPGVEIKVKRSTMLMHLKAYMVIDPSGKSLLFREGSANFSPAGESHQDNSAFFSRDPDLIAEFKSVFLEMWSRPDNLSVADAVASAPKWSSRRPPQNAPQKPS